MTTRTAKRQLTPVPFPQVTLDDPFWAPRQEVNRRVTIPHMHQKLVDTGRIPAFDLTHKYPVPTPIVVIFGDSDVAKWIEAASYSLITHPDVTLAKTLDTVVDKVILAQQADGYLNTHFTMTQPEMRWKNLRDWHEMYCAGHMMEGAVAHHQSTGDPKLLNALSRFADHIDQRFGPKSDQRPGYDGHPEVELALVRLYHATGERRYLELSKFFVEERGTSEPQHYYDREAVERGDDPRKFWAKNYEYCQAHAPVRQQDKVVGHAVRAMYLMSGIADLAHEYDDLSLLELCERLWNNLVYQRMYLTGGIGPSHRNEGFTSDYDLPDESAYAETCAAIALVMWNQRLLQVAGEGKYADIIEQTLYNGFISGVSLDGKTFFYENPLASHGHHHRTPWFDCPCCPPNLGRILASLGDYLYSTSDNAIWVHQYAQNRVGLSLNGEDVNLRLESNYPWEGNVKLTVDLAQARLFTLHLRIPGWCQQWSVTINGTPRKVDFAPINGYLALTRTWNAGDLVELDLSMPVQPVFAHPAVRQMQGRLAIMRGPIIYALEGVDNPGLENLDRIAVDPAALANFKFEHRSELLGGVTVLHGSGTLLDDSGWDNQTLYRRGGSTSTSLTDIVAVPYATWDNRAAGGMRVWLRAG